MLSYNDKIIKEFNDIFFMNNRGFIRQKTCIIKGKQYYKHATTEDVSEFISKALQGQMNIVNKVIPRKSKWFHQTVNNAISTIKKGFKDTGLN